MKKILFICLDLNNGGAERVISTLANELSQKYEVGIYMIKPSGEVKYLINESITLINNTRFLFSLPNIRRTIKNFDADVVVSFLAKTNIIVSLALVGSHQKLIVSERNDPNQNPKSKVIRYLRDYLYEFADIKGFVFQTKDAQAYFSKKVQKKSLVIHNPLVSQLPDFVKEKNFHRIVNVGRLDSQKNQRMLIKAFSNLPNNGNYILDIYGDGEMKSELIEYSKELGVEERVNFKGTTNKIHEEIKDAGLFAFSSDYEGMSNALIEAIAIGIPTLSTNHPIGGAKELIKDRENGLLTEVANAERFTTKMEEMLLNPDFSLKLAGNGLKLREDLSTQKIVLQWVNFFESVIE